MLQSNQQQDRPRSAVDNMTGALEVGRTRMSVEEQMERIRRHQQGALRERRREDGSLSRSLSFTRDNPYYTLQVPAPVNIHHTLHLGFSPERKQNPVCWTCVVCLDLEHQKYSDWLLFCLLNEGHDLTVVQYSINAQVTTEHE